MVAHLESVRHRGLLRAAWLGAIGAMLAAVPHLAFGAPSEASTHSAPEASDVDSASAPGESADAQSWYRRGVEAYKASDLPEAERCFRRAFELERSYGSAGNLGQTLFDQGKMAEAATVLRYAVSVFPPTVSPEARARAEQILAEAASHAVELTIQCSVAGAAVRVAGRPIGSCPLPLPAYAEPGTVMLEASLAGYAPAMRQVEGPAGGRVDVKLELVPTAAPLTSPASTTDGDSGAPTGTDNVPGIVVGAAALATAVVGVVLLAVASSQASDADSALADLRTQTGAQYPCAGAGVADSCADIVAWRQSHDDLTNASIPVLIGAGALAVVSGVLLGLAAADDPDEVASPSPDAQAAAARRAERQRGRWRALPWAGPSAAGLGVLVRY